MQNFEPDDCEYCLKLAQNPGMTFDPESGNHRLGVRTRLTHLPARSRGAHQTIGMSRMTQYKSKVENRPLASELESRSARPEALRPPVAGSTVRSMPLRLLRLAQVMDITGLGKTKIYELQSNGDFPMRVQITAHSVGWIEEEVQTWIAGRVAARSCPMAKSDRESLRQPSR
jgi:prophage regulatory protein